MDDEIIAVMMASLGTVACIYIAVFGFFIAMFWNIFAKAGFSGGRAFLLLIPIVNIIIFVMFAFGDWPARRELEQLRMQAQMHAGNQGPNVQQISISAPPQQPYQQPLPPSQYPQPYQQPYPPQYPHS